MLLVGLKKPILCRLLFQENGCKLIDSSPMFLTQQRKKGYRTRNAQATHPQISAELSGASPFNASPSLLCRMSCVGIVAYILSTDRAC